jgi:superfamily II DNA or RNA helicase
MGRQMKTVDPKSISPKTAALTDNNFLPKVADRLRADLDGGGKPLDIVTGYIAPSAWAVLGDALEKAGPTRILLGKDFQLAPQDATAEETDIRKLVLQALRREGQPPQLPTESDAKAIEQALAFLRRDDVAVKLWTDKFLHAKAFILPGTAGVGSANFTAGGLVANRELVTWREDRAVVEELRDWFNNYWAHESAVDYKSELIEELDRSTFGSHLYSPYELLIKVLAARYGDERPPSLESAEFNLKWFQEDAVFRLIKIIDGPAGGALLADAVGLGKTYMALGVIHHYLYNRARGKGRGQPILLIVPASLAGMWKDLLEEFGLAWACRIITIQSLNSDEDVSPYQGAGLVVVDEAHRLRGRGIWFGKVIDILTGDAQPDKQVLLLTATPLNTGIDDLTALLRVLTKNRRNVFAPAIADFERYLKRVEKREADPFPLLDRTIVRRSRSDILREYEERVKAGMRLEKPQLPDRELGHVDYKYDTAGGDLFDRFVVTLSQLRLAPYDLEPYRWNRPLPPSGIPEHSANSLASLVAAGLLKRFESSLRAISLSLNRMDVMLRRFGEALDATPPRLLDLSKSQEARALINEEREEDEDGESKFDERWRNVIDSLPPLSGVADYNLELVRDAIAHDRRAISELRAALPPEERDGKIAAMRALFARGGRLHARRTLIFSQFRDTAVYLNEALSDAGFRKTADVGEVRLVHGGTGSEQRREISSWFDPAHLKAISDARAPQVLISTDVLAEGHNLQEAQAVVNFDLHWNPQVAVQRAGRIDRLNSPHKLVTILSFLPEEGLERHLGLIRSLDRRFQLIHHLGLGDEPVVGLKGDKVTVSFEQMRRLYGDDVSILDEIERSWTLGSTDFMRAPLEAFINRHGLEKLASIPLGVQSVKALPTKGWKHGPGVFVALQLGTDSSKECLWRFYPRVGGEWGDPVLDEMELFRAIACGEGEPRASWHEPFPGPGGSIDWTLLRRAAEEVAEELTKRRATQALQKGASDRSNKLRLELRDASAGSGEVEGLDDLLDRLEEVRVEDYDGRSGWRPFRDSLNATRKARTAGERHDLMTETVRLSVRLFGPPKRESGAEPETVRAEHLQLVAWELLTTRSAKRLVEGPTLELIAEDEFPIR